MRKRVSFNIQPIQNITELGNDEGTGEEKKVEEVGEEEESDPVDKAEEEAGFRQQTLETQRAK